MLGHLRLLAIVCCEHDQTDFLKAVRFSLTTPRDISKIRAFYFSYYFGYVDPVSINICEFAVTFSRKIILKFKYSELSH